MKKIISFTSLIFFLSIAILRAPAFSRQSSPAGNAQPTAVKKEAPVQTPQNVTATQGAFADRVEIRWDAVSGVVKYQVYRADAENGDYDVMGTVPEATYRDSAAVPGKLYFYKIKSALTAEQTSAFSAAAKGYLKLAAPAIAVSAVGQNAISISWAAVAGAEKYYIYRMQPEEGEYRELAVTGELKYEDTSVQPGKMYYYRVKAYSAAVQYSDAGNTVSSSIKIGAPSAASENTDTEKVVIRISPVAGAEKYHIYRSETESGQYAEIGAADGNVFEDSTALPGRIYYYKVKSFTPSSGFSEAGTPVRGFIKLKSPKISVSGDSVGKLAVSWEKIAGAEKYHIFRSEDAGESSEIGTTSDIIYNDDKVKMKTAYSYRVRAWAQTGFSDDSPSASGEIAKTDKDLYLRSIVPGWGQFYQGREKEGYIYAGGFGLSLVCLGVSLYTQQKLWVDYAELSYGTKKSEFDSAYSKYKYATYTVWFFTALTAGVYAAHWNDILYVSTGKGLFSFSEEAMEASFGFSPYEDPALDDRGAVAWCRLRY